MAYVPREGEWKMAGGGFVRISEMEDGHLAATLRMLKRQYVLKCELEDADPKLWIHHRDDKFEELEHEAKRRKLKWDVGEQEAKDSRKQTKVWINATGQQFRICDMKDEHLKGVLVMLKRCGVMWRAIAVAEALESEHTGQDTIDKLLESDWRNHVPEPEMVRSLELDWFRRYPTVKWDAAADGTERALNMHESVKKLVKKLARGGRADAMEAKAERSIQF